METVAFPLVAIALFAVAVLRNKDDELDPFRRWAPDPPAWQFVAISGVVVSAGGVILAARGEPFGVGLIVVAIGWFAYSVLARRR